MRPWMLLVLLAACGRIGIDERPVDGDAPTGPDAKIDTMIDATIDVAVDAALACPSDMTQLSSSSSVCIELADRGDMPWLTGKALCEGLGRRYCTDAEWFEGCTTATNLVDITSNGWEWVAEEAGGIAQKRGGSGSCNDMTTHQVIDPYGVRCCGPMM